MGMHFYVSTGNKGGATKSFTAISLADYLIRQGENVILSDSEQDSIQATSTSIALNSGIQKFDMDAPSYPALAAWKLGRSGTGWSDCMDDLFRIGFDTDASIVADTGASQLQALIDNIEVIGAAVEAGMQATILFMAGRTEDSTVAAMSLLDAVKKLPEPQRPRIWILLVDQDGASAAEFDICQPFKTKDEQISRSILARATAEDPEHIHHRHVGRWPDILFNATMISRRLPAKVLQDKLIGFGTRTKLRIEMLAIDRLFTEILFSKKDNVSKEDASNVSI